MLLRSDRELLLIMQRRGRGGGGTEDPVQCTISKPDELMETLLYSILQTDRGIEETKYLLNPSTVGVKTLR